MIERRWRRFRFYAERLPAERRALIAVARVWRRGLDARIGRVRVIAFVAPTSTRDLFVWRKPEDAKREVEDLEEALREWRRDWLRRLRARGSSDRR